MSIKKFQIVFPGQVDVTPRIGHLYTDDTLSAVATAGYLNPYITSQGVEVRPTDIIAVCASNGTQFYKPVFSGTTVTLTVLP